MRPPWKIATPFLALVLALPLLVAPGTAAAATDRLPDLGMASLRNLTVETTTDGRRLLRFTTIVANVGAGDFEIQGQRAPGSTRMTLSQRIFDDAGGHRDVPTDAVGYFAGDGHTHWHVRNLQKYVLRRLDNGVLVGTGAKRGFCFYDNFNYGSPDPALYTRSSGACGSSATDTTTVMGLSTGWADKYGFRLPDQYIDITGLAAGRYRLRVTADARNWFQESNDGNNFTWVNLQITGDGVTVLKRGPHI